MTNGSGMMWFDSGVGSCGGGSGEIAKKRDQNNLINLILRKTNNKPGKANNKLPKVAVEKSGKTGRAKKDPVLGQTKVASLKKKSTKSKPSRGAAVVAVKSLSAAVVPKTKLPDLDENGECDEKLKTSFASGLYQKVSPVRDSFALDEIVQKDIKLMNAKVPTSCWLD